MLTDFQYSKYFVRSLGWYFSIDATSLCIAMEYLPEGDLRTYLETNLPLTEAECHEIVGQVSKGLQIMHREGFAHRDIKPAVSEVIHSAITSTDIHTRTF
jgi:serine/threonine protein kinase